VGAGPGGMTAAIYASRARLRTVVLERNTAGGIMNVTERIENYPGFPAGITGFELSELMKQQAIEFGADLREITSVVALEQRPGGGWLVVTDEDTVAARAVVLSPGVEARRLGVPGEAGSNVTDCPELLTAVHCVIVGHATEFKLKLVGGLTATGCCVTPDCGSNVISLPAASTAAHRVADGHATEFSWTPLSIKVALVVTPEIGSNVT